MSREIKVEQSPNYRTINVAGVIGMHYPTGFEIVFYSEDFECTDALNLQIDVNKLGAKRVIECRIVLEPSVAKAVQNNLNSIVSKYEEKFGKISLDNLINAKQDKKNAVSSDTNP